MSRKELDRHVILDRVVRKDVRLSEAVPLLGVSYRQAQRLLRGYEEQGVSFLVHGLRGRVGTRCCDPAFRAAVIAAYRETYVGFGPTFASEKLSEREGLVVNPETLRLWLVASGDWTVTKRRSRHRSRRKRKACFGEMLQCDGSHHRLFGDDFPKCCLMALVDDATGRMWLRFTEDEGTFAVMAVLRDWIEFYGIPLALYTDRLTTYHTDREPTITEQLAGQEPLTQLGRACDMLGIRMIAAHSPQAKGRVENKHKLTQDRLVKELRLAGVTNIADANAFLAKWLPTVSERFSVLPADATDMHRPAPNSADLDAILCRHEGRSVGKDWVVRYHNRYLQVVKQPDLPPSGSVVTVREWEAGALEVWYKDRRLRHEVLPARPERQKPEKVAAVPTKFVPAAEHPWRTHHKLPYDARPRAERIEEMVDRYLGEAHLPSEIGRGMRNVTLGGEL